MTPRKPRPPKHPTQRPATPQTPPTPQPHQREDLQRLIARLYDPCADPLQLWPEAHLEALLHGSDARDELERLVQARGFPGVLCPAGALLFGPEPPPRRRERPAPPIEPDHPMHALVTGIERALAEMAERTRPPVQ